MADETSDKKSPMWQPLTVSFAALAAAGWVAAGTFWFTDSSKMRGLEVELEETRLAQTDLQTRLAEHVETAGAFDEVSAALEEARSRLASVSDELAAAEGRLAELRSGVETAETDRDAALAETERLRAEAEPLEATLATFEEDAAQAEARIEEDRRTLSDVEGRIDEARAQEAELQASVAELSDEVARVSERAANAAADAQEARKSEARMLDQLRAAKEVDRLRGEREGIERNVAELTERRDEMSRTAEALATQREDLEAVVANMTETIKARDGRIEEIGNAIATISESVEAAETDAAAPADGEDATIDGSGKPAVAEIDAGIVDASPDGDATAGDAAGPDSDGMALAEASGETEEGSENAATPEEEGERAAASAPLSSIDPGIYQADVFMVTFSDDAEFNIIDTAKNLQAHGDYVVDDGVLTLNVDQSDDGIGSFPMVCAVSGDAESIRVDEVDGKCALLSGLVLVSSD